MTEVDLGLTAKPKDNNRSDCTGRELIFDPSLFC